MSVANRQSYRTLAYHGLSGPLKEDLGLILTRIRKRGMGDKLTTVPHFSRLAPSGVTFTMAFVSIHLSDVEFLGVYKRFLPVPVHASLEVRTISWIGFHVPIGTIAFTSALRGETGQ